jgi:hypothetical protein
MAADGKDLRAGKVIGKRSAQPFGLLEAPKFKSFLTRKLLAMKSKPALFVELVVTPR